MRITYSNLNRLIKEAVNEALNQNERAEHSFRRKKISEVKLNKRVGSEGNSFLASHEISSSNVAATKKKYDMYSTITSDPIIRDDLKKLCNKCGVALGDVGRVYNNDDHQLMEINSKWYLFEFDFDKDSWI